MRFGRSPAHRFLVRVLALFLLLLPGCSSEDVDRARPAETTTEATAPTAADMCAEHGVLEAVCTLCNPALAVVFQSKGDWCAEHALPESFCPICHPESGGRPLHAVGNEAAPSHGLRVTLASPDVARMAGIEVVRATEPPAGVPIVATATLVADNARRAAVGPGAEGILRAFHVRLGQRVETGARLATLESSVVADARADLQAARARVIVAEAQVVRERELHGAGVTPLRSLQEAEQELAAARAEVTTAASTLAMIGAEEAGDGGLYSIRAPLPGIVTEVEPAVGEFLAAETVICEILDTAWLWADIDVPELQAGRVRPGLAVEIRVDGLGDRVFTGRIDYIAPQIDAHTRTVRARAAVENREGVLRANTYARVRILAPAEGAGALVPRAAVQSVKGTNLVFVPVSEQEFETRRVRTLPSDGDFVAVVSGIEAGEDVVTTGAFLLKTETLVGAIGAGCCEVPGGR